MKSNKLVPNDKTTEKYEMNKSHRVSNKNLHIYQKRLLHSYQNKGVSHTDYVIIFNLLNRFFYEFPDFLNNPMRKKISIYILDKFNQCTNHHSADDSYKFVKNYLNVLNTLFNENIGFLNLTIGEKIDFFTTITKEINLESSDLKNNLIQIFTNSSVLNKSNLKFNKKKKKEDNKKKREKYLEFLERRLIELEFQSKSRERIKKRLIEKYDEGYSFKDLLNIFNEECEKEKNKCWKKENKNQNSSLNKNSMGTMRKRKEKKQKQTNKVFENKYSEPLNDDDIIKIRRKYLYG